MNIPTFVVPIHDFSTFSLFLWFNQKIYILWTRTINFFLFKIIVRKVRTRDNWCLFPRESLASFKIIQMFLPSTKSLYFYPSVFAFLISSVQYPPVNTSFDGVFQAVSISHATNCMRLNTFDVPTLAFQCRSASTCVSGKKWVRRPKLRRCGAICCAFCKCPLFRLLDRRPHVRSSLNIERECIN